MEDPGEPSLIIRHITMSEHHSGGMKLWNYDTEMYSQSLSGMKNSAQLLISITGIKVTEEIRRKG